MSAEQAITAATERFLPDETATRSLGAELARLATPGTIILLDGPLGAGKTTFVQGFTAAIGASAAASPSFVIAHYYGGAAMPVWHIDLYRLERREEIADLDLDQYLPHEGIALVEWASRAPDEWPLERIEIAVAIDGTGRRAAIVGFGRFSSVVRALSGAVKSV